MANHPIFQFKAQLSGYNPKIWRRFQVSNHISLARLAYIVMTMFEMEASHLFAVEVFVGKNLLRHMKAEMPNLVNSDLLARYPFNDVVRYQILAEEDEYSDSAPSDPVHENLKHAVYRIGDELCVEYDFGDGWNIQLTLEKVFIDKELPGRQLPRVLAGEGFGIIEDCGGPGGLKQLARSFAKRKGDAYEENRMWLGIDDLDLTTFDLEDMNFRVKKVPRIYADIYERDLPPTKASIDLLTRKYKELR